MPQFFILQCKEEIAQFKADTIDLDMPVIHRTGMNSIVGDIVDAISGDQSQTNNLGIRNAVVYYLYEHSAGRDDDYLLSGVELRLYRAAMRLGSAIKNKLKLHHAYVDGTLPYTFEKFITNDTFYLTRK
jgi:hypothetical protein